MKPELSDWHGGLDQVRPQIHERIVLRAATEKDRQQIYRLRHEVYGHELGQHALEPSGTLCDQLDAWNHYLVACIDERIAGFISITPPGQASYSIDKYVARSALPFPVDNRLYEVRLLTVLKPLLAGWRRWAWRSSQAWPTFSSVIYPLLVLMPPRW